jgi:aspartate beta-hydroxylase
MGSFYDRTAAAVRRIYGWRIDSPPVLDMAEHFPAGARFAAGWREMRAEALRAADRLWEVPRFHEIMREQADISANDGRDWRMLILRAYGVEFPENRGRCPTLAALAASAPGVLSASVSFLAPGKHIPPHRGPFRGVLRYYLVLAMPRRADGRPAAVLRIAGRDYRLEEGESLLWDDTFEHEVWNESDHVRAVVLLDVWRPGMPMDMVLLSRALIGLAQAGIRLRGAA